MTGIFHRGRGGRGGRGGGGPGPGGRGSPSNIILDGGRFPHEGNILVDGQPVCDDEWSLVDAHVACKEMGYYGAVSATSRSEYGRTSPEFAMDNVECDGTETRLLDCPHSKVLDIICRFNIH